MDLFPSIMRLKSIFSPQQDIGVRTKHSVFDEIPQPDVPDSSGVEEEDPIQSKLMELFSSKSPAMERYNHYLESQPSRADYNPSWKRRLGAILGGALTGFASPELGFHVSNDIVNSPYKDAESDWEKRRLPLANAATAEASNRNSNINLLKDYIQTRHQNRMDDSLITDRKDNAAHRKAVERQQSESLLNTISHQQALEAIANKNAEETANYHKTTAAQRKADSEARRKEEQARINIAKGNQELAGRRTTAYENNATSITAYRDFLKNKYDNEKNTPTAQKTAQELAVYNVLTTPGNTQRFSNFIEQDSHGKFIIHPPDKSLFQSDDAFNAELAEYTELNKRIKAESDKIMSSTRNPPNTSSGTPKDVPGKVDNKKKPKIITTQKLPGGM